MDPTKRRIRQVQRLAEKAEPLREFGKAGPGRGNRVPGKAPTIKPGSTEYWLGRIARDRPDILKRMKAGEFESVKKAARAASFLEPRTRLTQFQQVWRNASDEERKAMAVDVMGWLLCQDETVYDAIVGKAEKHSGANGTQMSRRTRYQGK
jgi:hypothetical protein